MSIYLCLLNNKKIEDLVRIIVDVTLIIENISGVSLMPNQREAHMFYLARDEGNGKNLEMLFLRKR